MVWNAVRVALFAGLSSRDQHSVVHGMESLVAVCALVVACLASILMFDLFGHTDLSLVFTMCTYTTCFTAYLFLLLATGARMNEQQSSDSEMLAKLKLRLYSVQISCSRLHAEADAATVGAEASDVSLRSLRQIPRGVGTGECGCTLSSSFLHTWSCPGSSNVGNTVGPTSFGVEGSAASAAVLQMQTLRRSPAKEGSGSEFGQTSDAFVSDDDVGASDDDGDGMVRGGRGGGGSRADGIDARARGVAQGDATAGSDGARVRIQSDTPMRHSDIPLVIA